MSVTFLQPDREKFAANLEQLAKDMRAGKAHSVALAAVGSFVGDEDGDQFMRLTYVEEPYGLLGLLQSISNAIDMEYVVADEED